MKLLLLLLAIICTSDEQSCSKFEKHKRMKRQDRCSTSNCSICVDGLFGKSCRKKCPINCEGTCNKTSGQCDYSCKKNWGPCCEDKCPLNCLEGCNMSSGLCNGGCNNSWYGPKCYQECPKNCAFNICQQYTGECFRGCKKGFYGKTCGKECSGCQDEDCHQNGTCINGSVHGVTVPKNNTVASVSDSTAGRGKFAVIVAAVIVTYAFVKR